MKEKISENFKTLTGFEPRQFQKETIQQLLQGKNVLLRAPTGSGKTETAIAPFLLARQMEVTNFPNKLIYVVPLRTLATSLRDRARNLVEAWENVYPPQRPLVVTLQTGENPEDPRFEGDIVFCTIDQILSSFLSIPYSVGRGSANVNAGVVFASYLVFDELHLLDPDRSFVTVLKLLKQVQGISPYLLMTATLTHELVAQIQQEITPRRVNPETVLSLINVQGDDLLNIEGKRQRQFRKSSQALSAELIWRDIQAFGRKRVIVICNTVAKSQGLFLALQALVPETVKVMLLHSRFLPEHRKAKEIRLQQIFAKNWQEQDDGICYVLISTQVVEAGINITSEVLHTLLCPMNSLLQRAGRCARFADEIGQIIVYRQISVEGALQGLAEAEDDQEVSEKQPKRNFLPYKDDLCELTWQALLEHESTGQNEMSVGFVGEEAWINQVHGEEDRKQAIKRGQNCQEFENNFDKAVLQGDSSVAKDLIRFVDNRNIYMVEDPTMINLEVSDDVDIKQLQAFSLPKSTLLGIWRDYCNSQDRQWIFKKVESPKDKEGYALPQARLINRSEDPSTSIWIIVNPKYVKYDQEVGLQVGVQIKDNYQSPKKDSNAQPKSEYSYKMDTYIGHLGRIWTCWEYEFKGELKIDGQLTQCRLASSQVELKQAGGKLIQRKIFPDATLAKAEALFEFLVFLAVITHDLGKLQVTWQAAMQGWQQTAFKLYRSLSSDPGFKVTDPKDLLLAHTDHHPEDSLFKKAYQDFFATHSRPPHAVESAFLADEILEATLVPLLTGDFGADEEQVGLICCTAEMAAGRHHSAWAKGWGDSDDKITLHLRANAEIQQSWQQLSRRLKGGLCLPASLPVLAKSHQKEEFKLGNEIGPDQLAYMQLYWLIIRALRVCDGRSVQLH
jgi:CRISPR-associated endonuclease/helicase Cas3